MIDILIPLTDNSPTDFIELKYCLRSVEKYGEGVGTVYIVGGRPTWINNVFHIPMTDSHDKVFGKARNILNKILTGCNWAISEDFIMFNDDFFLLGATDLENYPYFIDINSLPKIYELPKHYAYRQTTLRTNKLFPENFTSFEIHRPIKFNKNEFTAVLSELRTDYDFLIRSYYANKLNKEPIFATDLKINHPTTYDKIKEIIKDKPIFSTTDLAVNKEMVKVLDELYPNKSKFEV